MKICHAQIICTLNRRRLLVHYSGKLCCELHHEDMDDHDRAEYAAIEGQRSSKEELQVPSAQWVVQFRRVLPVALEIDAQHDWDAEDELSIWGDGMKAVCTKPKISQLD